MVCTDIVWYGTAEQDHATRVQKKQNTNGFPYCGCVNVSKPSKTRFSVSRLKPAERKRYYRLFFYYLENNASYPGFVFFKNMSSCAHLYTVFFSILIITPPTRYFFFKYAIRCPSLGKTQYRTTHLVHSDTGRYLFYFVPGGFYV